MSNVGWSKKTWTSKLPPPSQGDLARWSTKADFAYEALRQAIVTGVLEPTQQINPKQVAADLGMSIIPVREAMRRLEQDELLIIRPYIGAEVKELPIDELCENLLIRSQLESLAAELATPLMNETTLGKLKDQIDLQNACVTEKQFEKFGALNRQFHMTIYEIVKERRLIKLIDQLWDQVPRAACVFTLVPERAVIVVEEHIRIFEALRDRNAELAGRLVRDHKLGGRAVVANVLDQIEKKPATATA